MVDRSGQPARLRRTRRPGAHPGVLWLWQRRSRTSCWRGWPALLVGLAAADLLVFAWAIHPREPLAKLAAEPPAVRRWSQLPRLDGTPNRLSPREVLNQLSADRLAPFGVQEANGYSSLQFVWHRDYLSRVLYVDDGLLDLWNVRYVLDPARYGALRITGGEFPAATDAAARARPAVPLASSEFALAAGRRSSNWASCRRCSAPSTYRRARRWPKSSCARDGQIVGTAELLAGRDSMDWAWDLPTVQPYVKHERVEERRRGVRRQLEPRERPAVVRRLHLRRPVTATSLVVRATLPSGEFALFGGTAVSADGAVQQLFGRTKTKYRQVYVDNEIRVFENTAAMPRAFLVPTARVAPSLGTALSEMIHQPFHPDQEVILADDATTQARVGGRSWWPRLGHHRRLRWRTTSRFTRRRRPTRGSS